MNKKDPAFLFYPKDWLEGTAEMTPFEKGIYIDLLSYQHQRSELPSDTKRLSTMVGLPLDEFLLAWEILKDKFLLTKTGKLANQKLSKVGTERKQHSKMRKILGTFGGLLRASDANDKIKGKIRNMFNFNDFIETEEQELSSVLAIWLANSLANAQPIVKQTIEDGNGIGNEDGNEDVSFRKCENLFFNYKWGEYEKVKEKVLDFAKIIDTDLHKIQKMPSPLTAIQLCKLVNNYPSSDLMEVLVSMNNYKKLLTNSESAYQTCWTWLKKREKNV